MKKFVIKIKSYTKLSLFFCIMMLPLFISTTSSSEFYKYIDEDGFVRYTDDPSTITPEQRPGVETYESINSSSLQDSDQGNKTGEDSYLTESLPGNNGNEQAYQSGSESTEESWKQKATSELDAMRKELRERHEKINAMRKALDEAKSGAKEVYIQKSEELNRQIAEYNQMSKDFDQKVQEYNRKISQE